MRKQLLSLLIVATMAGCTTHKDDSATHEVGGADSAAQHYEAHVHGGEDPRAKEVMAIHDSIMPAMETIMELKDKIAVTIKSTDSLLALKSAAHLKAQKAQAVLIQKQLEQADEEMMGWMHQYHADTLGKLDDSGVVAYLTDQKRKIESVRDRMKKSIADAQSFIQKTK